MKLKGKVLETYVRELLKDKETMYYHCCAGDKIFSDQDMTQEVMNLGAIKEEEEGIPFPVSEYNVTSGYCDPHYVKMRQKIAFHKVYDKIMIKNKGKTLYEEAEQFTRDMGCRRFKNSKSIDQVVENIAKRHNVSIGVFYETYMQVYKDRCERYRK